MLQNKAKKALKGTTHSPMQETHTVIANGRGLKTEVLGGKHIDLQKRGSVSNNTKEIHSASTSGCKAALLGKKNNEYSW